MQFRSPFRETALRRDNLEHMSSSSSLVPGVPHFSEKMLVLVLNLPRPAQYGNKYRAFICFWRYFEGFTKSDSPSEELPGLRAGNPVLNLLRISEALRPSNPKPQNAFCFPEPNPAYPGAIELFRGAVRNTASRIW